MAWRELLSIVASILAFLFMLGAFAPLAEELGVLPENFPLVSFSKPKLQYEQTAPCLTHELQIRGKCDAKGRKVVESGTISSKDSVLGLALSCAVRGYSPLNSCKIVDRAYPQIWRLYLYAALWLFSLVLSLWGVWRLWRYRKAYLSALRRLFRQLRQRHHDNAQFPSSSPTFRHLQTWVDIWFIAFATWIYSTFAEYLMKIDNFGPSSGVTYSVSNLSSIVFVAVGVVSIKFLLWAWYLARRE